MVWPALLLNSRRTFVPHKLRFLPTKATFELGDRLGAGTVGVVFRATSPDLDEPVAVKLLHPAVSDEPKIVDRFEREVMIMERLDHPHIVRHYGGGMMDGQYFYAMQLLNHGTLKDRLRKHGPISWPQVAAYGDQIASALQHAHNHGVIHRDLKPSNLFFAADGRLILGDFGIAFDKYDADITDHGVTVGTYSYMSPEQIRADGNITGQADLYSLGCLMYEMLTGQAPFQGANFAQVWEQHLHAEPTGIREQGIDCPQWLEELIFEMLAKEPRDRPFNARAVQGILRQRLSEDFGDRAKELTRVLPMLPEAKMAPEHSVRMWPFWCAILIAVVGIVGIMVASR